MQRISLKISDFGLARGFDRSRDVQTLTALGTPCFMAPEVLEANSLGEAYYSASADVYALGLVANYLYTKRPPGQLSQQFVGGKHQQHTHS